MSFVKNDQLKICELERWQRKLNNCLYLLLNKVGIEKKKTFLLCTEFTTAFVVIIFIWIKRRHEINS